MFFVGLSAIIVSNAIEISSGFYVAPGANTIENPVAQYFKNRELPQGMVYFGNVSEASYFAPQGIRYAASYNEHAQPHPYSTRLRMLMRQSVSYTGLSGTNIENIENYATVLGIEYLFLPATSPLVPGLTEKENAYFVKVEDVQSAQLADNISVLRYTRPIQYAYVFEKKDVPAELISGDIKKPTIEVSSYTVWDERIATMAKFLRQEKGVAVPISFIDTDKLSVNLAEYHKNKTFEHPIVFVNQSYDQHWKIVNGALEIYPTPLRLMYVDLIGPDGKVSSLRFTNSWPAWHWPVQAMGLSMIILTTTHYILSRKKKRA
jgi:hypothetical protein